MGNCCPLCNGHRFRYNDGMSDRPLRIEMIDDQMAEILRAKSPSEKVAMISAAHSTARVLVQAGIRYQHPEWDDLRVHTEIAKRVSGGTS